MSVSVIIPVLNEASNLAEHLPKLNKQSNLCEIIIADGGSSDNSAQIADQHGASLYKTASGRARQMNEGAKQAGGNILLFLHADSELPPDALQQIQTLIDRGVTWGRFNVRLSGKQWLLRIVERLINWRSCITGIATGDQGIFLKRDLFESLGGYAEIPLMEDVELSKRLKKLARPHCIRTPIITSSRRWEHHGIVRTIILMWRMRFFYARGASPEKLAAQYRRSNTKGQGS